MSARFQGSFVAMVTPFRDGKVDESKLAELVEFHAANGTDGLVPCGTTGESPTLSHDEHKRVVELVVKAARKRLPVVAGTGSNSTAEAIDLTTHAERAGADGALVVNPYYNKPTQEGLYLHFRAVASAVRIPILVYNIQGRTGVNVETATLARLARDCANIVGVKEASGNIGQMAAVCHNMPERFDVLSGDDAVTIPLIALGGRGLISVASNEIPAEMTKLVQLALAGDFAGARVLQRAWLPLMEVNFVESNPIPVKAAMAMMGLLEPVYRLPMVPPLPQNHARIEGVLKSAGLLAAPLVGARGTHAD